MHIDQVRRFALSLPETTEAPHFTYSSFRVQGNIFVTVPPEGTHIHVFAADQEREEALELHSEFVEKLFWGQKVCGVRVMLAEAEPEVVHDLVRKAWQRKAPKAKTRAKFK